MIKNIIDVSDHQGVIDWEKVKPQIDGAMIRCSWSYGEKNDKQFERNISECNRLGIPCGVYLFSYALNDDEARKEAEWCLELIKPYRLELPVAWDFEYASVDYCARHGLTVTKEIATRWAHIFLETIEKAGYWATLYTNADFLNRYFEEGIENRFDLWYAGWVDGIPEYDSELSYACGIWQYGLRPYDGIQDGKEGADSNYCYKDYAALFKLYGLNHLDRVTETRPDYVITAEKYGFDTENPTEAATKEDIWKLLHALKGDTI